MIGQLAIIGALVMLLIIFIVWRSNKKSKKGAERSFVDIVLGRIKVVIGFYQVTFGIMEAFSYIKWPGSLSVIGHHYMARVHSTHENNDWTNEAFPQRVFINKIDAQKRNISNGEKVKIYNDRGTIIMQCRVTNKILPGVIDIPQGAWWEPDENGIDRRGNVNVFSSEKWTPLAFGNAQHTIMAEIEKVIK